jgi:hypothetical protein
VDGRIQISFECMVKMACWDSKRPKLDANGHLCLPSNPCGPCLGPPEFQGTLIPSNGSGKSLAAFMQRDTRRDTYIMYGADEDLNVIQLLRSKEKIKLTPDNGEVLKEPVLLKEYVLSRPYFIDSAVQITY